MVKRLIIVAAVASGSVGFADMADAKILVRRNPPAATATTPAGPETKPAEATSENKEIKALIEELGAIDFRSRELASEKLRAIGKPALADLRHAAKKHDDPEVRSRAELLAEVIEPAPKAAVAPGVITITGGGGMRVTDVRANAVGGAIGGKGTVRTSSRTDEKGRTISIKESSDGIEVEVKEKAADGTVKATSYKAKDAAELKEKHPEGHKIYEQETARKNGGLKRQEH